MPSNIDAALVAVYLDRIETLVSAVLAKHVTTTSAQPLIERDFAELRGLCGLALPAVRTGTAPFVPGEAAEVAKRVRRMKANPGGTALLAQTGAAGAE